MPISNTTNEEFINAINSNRTPNWPDAVKQEIKDYLIWVYGQRFTIVDIQVVGSHVFGGHREYSDVDIWIYVQEKMPNGERYDLRSDSLSTYKNVQLDVKIRTVPEDGSVTKRTYKGHPEQPFPDDPDRQGWVLPVYSLITNQLLDGVNNDLDHYVQTKFKKDLQAGILPHKPETPTSV